MFDTRALLILIPALPLVAAIVTAVLGPRVLRQNSHWPAVVGIIGSFLCSVAIAWQAQDSPSEHLELVPLWTWANVTDAYDPPHRIADSSETPLTVGGLHSLDIEVVLRADTLTRMMLVMVTLVSSLVTIYSIGYMHGDEGYWRFFAYVSLFVFSMTMLVSVSNFALLYVFWEAVGVCSYFLIGFWYQKPEAAAAGKKAFLVNRVGDFGFALALFLIWTTYGTLNFHDTPDAVGVLGARRLSGEFGFAGGGCGLAICLLLMVGACGKSAQFPLHVWLPDAMEGPTPVSALIHAATMVTAGVYMVARCTPLFMASPDAQVIVSVIGGFTALLAASIALTQYDLKRILAYSTISQLGYMFLALGTGTLAGITAGMFHLFTHAFFKALLFLGAGSVMHAMGNVIDIRRFGGLRRTLPITHWTFAFGCLALAGIFPFAGFWSKDTVLACVHDKVHEIGHSLQLQAESVEAAASVAIWPTRYITPERAHTTYQLLYYAALLTAFLTALYTFRAYFVTFHGKEKIPRQAGHHAHESPPTMWVPLTILAAFALVIGLVLEPTHLFANMLGRAPVLSYPAVRATTGPGTFHMQVAFASTLMALAGVGTAAFLYLGHRREVRALKYLFSFEWLPRLAQWLSPISPYRLSFGKFYFDEVYAVLFVWPLRTLAQLSFLIDRRLIDGLVNTLGRVPLWVGGLMRTLQIGFVPFYGLAMVLGIVLTFIVVQALWSGG